MPLILLRSRCETFFFEFSYHFRVLLILLWRRCIEHKSQIYKLDLTQSPPVKSLLASGSILCGSPCINFAGPNGIVLYTDANAVNWLLVAVYPTSLVKINTVTGATSVIQPGSNTKPGSLSSTDGMAIQNLGPSNSILYATGILQSDGLVQVLTSLDSW